MFFLFLFGFGGSNGRENRNQGCSPVFGAVLDCVHTALVHRRLVVELRAVWRCVAYEGGVVGCERVLDVSVLLDVDVVVVVKQ